MLINLAANSFTPTTNNKTMKEDSKIHITPTNANNMLVEVADSFIKWKDGLHKELRGGKLMFDVPKHYKWLDELELFIYYTDVGRYCQ